MKCNNLIVILFSAVIFTACSKDKTTSIPGTSPDNTDPNTTVLSEEEKFLVGSWQLETVVDTFQPKTDPDKRIITEGTVTCKADDIYHLGADKKYTKEEGLDTCAKGQSYAPKDWGLLYGAIIFSDGPNPPAFSNKFRKIDNDHFSIAWGNQEWEGYRIRVYFYRRVK